MATRSPQPLVGASLVPLDAPTTTISTIVVKAGDEAFLTVALLQSGELAKLRIDEMRPPLLSIGRNEEENTRLLTIHQNLLKKLAMKEEECEALLAKAAALPAEKDEEEAKVYTAMAASLDSTWRGLLRRLHLRENLLVDMSTFYRLLSSHEEVSRVCISAISSLSQSQSPDGLARQIGVSVNEIVDITARAMETGSGVMGQLRILGQLSENEGREEEIYRAMLLVEAAMLKMGAEWNHVEESWVEEKRKRALITPIGEEADIVDRELEEIGQWLSHAGKRLRASTQEGMKTILAEAEEQRSRLIGIISQTEDDRKLAKAGELARGVEELLALTRAALNKGCRLRNFFVSATNMYQQLLGMEADMERANEAMAGELAPLARQKGTTLSEEATDILERERVTHDERRMVTLKRDEIMQKIEQIEKIAAEKKDSGKMQARENLRRGREWLVREGEPWMQREGKMGGNSQTASQFLQSHSAFAETILKNDSAIQFALNESSRLSEEEQRSAQEFEERYTRLRSQLEQRLHLAKSFQQVCDFARELDASFESLSKLIDQKAEHSERGLEQMSKVFEMIEETIGQERAQGDRFVSSASAQEPLDVALRTEEAREAVRAIILKHEHTFTNMAHNWNQWHAKAQSVQQQQAESRVDASRVLEEVQMWQEESIEIIRLWEEKREGVEREEVTRRLEEVRARLESERAKVESVKRSATDESTTLKIDQTLQKQREIEQRMQKVQSQVVEEEKAVMERARAVEAIRSEETSRAIEEVQMWQEETIERIRVWENDREEKKEEQRTEIQRECEKLKSEVIVQSEKIERMKGSTQDESTMRRVLETVLREREIDERIDGVRRRLTEERRVEEDSRRVEEERSKRTLEEISMWQEEIFTILRLWEDYRMERSINEKEEIDKSIEAIRMDSTVQKERIEGTKAFLKDQESQSRIASVEEKQRTIEQRLEKIQTGMRKENEEKKRIIMEQQVGLRKTLDEIQMWQEETTEIIRLWREKNHEEKKVELEKVSRQAEEVTQTIQKSLPAVQDEVTSRRVEEIKTRQAEIASSIKSEKQAQLTQLKRALEEISMWQEETVEIIRLWKEHTTEEAKAKVVETNAKLEEINERIQKSTREVNDQETAKRVEEIVVRQNEIGSTLKMMKQTEQVELKRALDEIEMWQEETVEIIRLWSEKKVEEKTVKVEEVHAKMEDINQRIQQSLPSVKDQDTARRVEKIAVRQSEIASIVQAEKQAQQVQLKKALEEIEMWQEETVEIIRLWKDVKTEETKVKVEESSGKIEEMNEKIVKTAQVVREAESAQRLEKIATRQREIEAILLTEQQLQQTHLKRTLDEIEMWQDETVEIIRLWSQKKTEETKVKVEESSGKIEEINERIQRSIPTVKDEQTARRVEEISTRQREIVNSLQAVRQAQAMELKRTLEEIEMWQDESMEMIRLWSEKKETERKRVEVEEVSGKIEEMNERIERSVKEVRDEETVKRVERISARQIEIANRLKLEQQNLQSELLKTVEEIEMWQDETMEIIRLWSEKKREIKKVEVEEIRGKTEEVSQVIQNKIRAVRDEETARRVERIAQRQTEIIQKVKTMESAVRAKVMERPRILTQLLPLTIEQGKRVEFVAKIESKPEATIRWLKDGQELEQSSECRRSFVNGVATLSIEETFIEDSALYTIKASNEGGEAESSATLTVTKVDTEWEAPRFVRGLKSSGVEEGERLLLDCVVLAKPEPHVVWFKEERTIQEDARTQLDFKGDHCSLILSPTTLADSGMYTAKAKNMHGEATSLCQVKVSPKKIPPPTPPKPDRPASGMGAPSRPPAMQCTLANETYQEGMKALLQVLVTGSPRPSIQWFINDTPVQTTERVRVTTEEDGWTRLAVDSIREEDAGLYMVVAENEEGEARTGATIHVQPKMTISQVRQSFEEASGSEGVQTVLEREIDEPVPHSTTLNTHTKDVEEFGERESLEAFAAPQRDQMNTTATTVTTTTTSHIPVPAATRVRKEEIVQGEIGLSNTSTAPDVIRALQKEYTVNEEEELFLEILLVANPRPKVQWFFNDSPIHPTSSSVEISASGDSYSLRVKKATLHNAGYYRVRVENIRGEREDSCIVHIRPLALGPAPKTRQHVTVQEEFAMFEYDQRRPEHLYESRIPTLKNGPSNQMNGLLEKKKATEYLEGYDLSERERVGNPPHFTHTLLSAVTVDGGAAKFDAIVTGWPSPLMEWWKDGVPITPQSHPHITLSNIGGRVSLSFADAAVADSGKYKCTASNEWGVATSSAQLVVRPKTVAPDFISRLISEEIGEGETLKWTVRVTGDPLPSVVWLRDGIIIPNCDEVKIIDEGEGVHSMVIHRIETADSGQFTCLAENSAGEARSTADLVVRPEGAEPGHYFHVTKVTQEKQVKGQPVAAGRNETFAIESPMV